MPVLRAFVLASLAVSAGAGCASQGADERTGEDDLEIRRSLHGIVLVERVDASDGARGSVSAKFMRVTAQDRALTERLIGARPVIPEATECVPVPVLEQAEAEAQRTAIWADRLRSDTNAADARGSASRELAVELLDVGDVRLLVHADAGDVDVALAPRAFPDVGDLASGVFYTSPDAEMSLPASARYELGGSGTDALDAFIIEVAAPPAPSSLRIVGDADALDGTTRLRRGVDLPIEWDAGATSADGNAEDVVYVDVRETGAESAFRCTFPDVGGATLPADVLASSPGVASGAPAEVTVTLHRLAERHASLSVTQDANAVGEAKVGDATVRFDLARSVRVVIH